MSAVTALTIGLLVAAIAACVAIIWLSREAVATARSMRDLTDDVRERLVPMLDKVDITIDATNAELMRIDGAITRFDEASVRVSAAAGTLSEIVQAPEKIVSGVAGRVRRAWKDRRRTNPDESESLISEGNEEYVDAVDEFDDVAVVQPYEPDLTGTGEELAHDE